MSDKPEASTVRSGDGIDPPIDLPELATQTYKTAPPPRHRRSFCAAEAQQRASAENQRDLAADARSKSDHFTRFVLNDMTSRLAMLNRLDLLEPAIARTFEYYKSLPLDRVSPAEAKAARLRGNSALQADALAVGAPFIETAWTSPGEAFEAIDRMIRLDQVAIENSPESPLPHLIRPSSSEVEPARPANERGTINATNIASVARQRIGYREEALGDWKSALERLGRLRDRDPANTHWASLEVSIVNNMINVLDKLERPQEAEPLSQQLLASRASRPSRPQS